MEIFTRGGDAGVSQGGLHQMNRAAPVKGMAGVGMAKPMRTDLAIDASPGNGGLY
jgi:hypothetical protein